MSTRFLKCFPPDFFDEHFYYAAGANLTPVNGARTSLVLAVEAAFGTGAPLAGDQVTFSRIRVVMTNPPVAGTYRFIHPYGEKSFTVAAGERIFFTDDVGIGGTPGDFSGALRSDLGPFLLPSNAPGGAELPRSPARPVATSPTPPGSGRSPAARWEPLSIRKVPYATTTSSASKVLPTPC